MPVWSEVDAALLEFSKRIDTSRQDLYFLDAAVMGALAGRPELAATTRASAYVLASAALEQFTISTIDAVLRQIEVSGCSLQELRLSLFSLVHGADFDTLQQVRKLKMWRLRASVFQSVDSADATNFQPEARPLDGGTLVAEHFQTIWTVFGLVGDHLPGGTHVGALLDLSTNRNSLAHGDEPATTIGRRKTTNDVLRMLGHVEDIALHLYGRAYDYLDNADYKR